MVDFLKYNNSNDHSLCDVIECVILSPPYQDIDGLNDVNKHLVLLVFDAL